MVRKQANYLGQLGENLSKYETILGGLLLNMPNLKFICHQGRLPEILMNAM